MIITAVSGMSEFLLKHKWHYSASMTFPYSQPGRSCCLKRTVVGKLYPFGKFLSIRTEDTLMDALC